MLEADRLEALRILRERLEELATATADLNAELEEITKNLLKNVSKKPKDALADPVKDLAKDVLKKPREDLQVVTTLAGAWSEAMAAVKEKIAGIKEELGLVREELDKVKASSAILEQLKADIADALEQAVIQGAVDAFVAMGDALARGEGAANAFGQSLQSTVAQVARSISTLAIAAAMQQFILGNVPLGLALLAIGGIAAVASGYMSAKEAEINNQYQEEMDARQALIDALKEQLDLELDVIRDAWQRNLISTPEYVDLSKEKTAEAAAAEAAIPAAEMPGLTTDEWKEGVVDVAGEGARPIVEAFEDAIEWWRGLWSGENRRNRRARRAAAGADYITDGPEWLMVGDNASGREHVMVNPAPGGGMGTIINFNGPVFGNPDDIAVEIKNMMDGAQRRGLISA
jgi:hypothetical protein